MVTIVDVARHAGVSVSTVSYTLSGKRTISPETRERIERSVAELGYRPNARARALASRRTRTLALAAPLRVDNNVPVVMHFVAAIATAAREHEHDILLLTQAEGGAEIRRVSETGMVDALILMDVEADDARLPALRRLGLPTVLVGVAENAGGLSSVDLDFRGAAQACVDHLVGLGHRDLLMIGSPPGVYERRSNYALAFADGFESAVREHGVRGRWTPSAASYEAASDLLVRQLSEHPATALVVHNEAVLGTVMTTLRRMGLRVPEDISVAAICPEQMAVDQAVELTGVAVPADQIGRAAVEMVLRQVDGDVTPEARLIGPRLTVRQSTAPPPSSTPDLGDPAP